MGKAEEPAGGRAAVSRRLSLRDASRILAYAAVAVAALGFVAWVALR